MSIKFIDKLEPNGNFPLVDANTIEYSTKYINEAGVQVQVYNTKEALDVLYDRIMAEPVLKYYRADSDESIPTIYTSAVELGQDIGLPFYVQTPSIGNWTITLYRRVHGSGDDYRFYKTIPLPKGTTVVPLGTCNEYSDYDYKVEVLDGAGKTAYTPWLEDDGATKKASLEYRVYCSSLSYNLNPTTNQLETIYTLDSFELSGVNISFKTGMSGYGHLYYKVFSPSEIIPDGVAAEDLESYSKVSLNSGALLETNKQLRANVTFDIPSGQDAGTSTIVTCFVISNESDPDASSEVSISALRMMHLDRLAANTTSVSVLTSLNQEISTADSSTLDILVKTTLGNLLYENTVKLEGYIYYVCEPNSASHYYSESDNIITDNSEYPGSKIPLKRLVNKNWEKIGTPNRGAIRWNISRINFPTELQQDQNIKLLNCYLEIKSSSVSTLPSNLNPKETFINYITTFELRKQEGVSGYITQNLLFNFNTLDPNLNAGAADDGITDGVTIAAQQRVIDNENCTVGLKLFGTTAGSSGIVEGTEITDASTRLRLTKGSYAMLYKRGNGRTIAQPYSPWKTLASAAKDYKTFTLEAYLKVADLGDPLNRALTLMDDTDREHMDGISIGANDMYANLKGYSNKVFLRPGAWQHLVIVIDAEEDISTATDLNPYPTLRIYIDGVLSKITRFNADAAGLLSSSSGMPPLVLNGAISSANDSQIDYDSANTSINNLKISGDGDCEFKVIRIYDAALSSSEVYQNFLDTREGETAIETIVNRNNDSIPKIYFVSNQIYSQQDANRYITDSTDQDTITKARKDLARWEVYTAPSKPTKKLNPTTFEALNTLTTKDTVENDKGQVVHGSKTSLVNCSVYVKKDGITSLYNDDVDVYLQGTSSLAYPVKNYQIKINNLTQDAESQTYTRTSLVKLPPLQNETTGWYTESSVYTLKCDFMEHSHRNNTPTARYYQDTVLDNVIKAVHGEAVNAAEYYSPAHSIIESRTIDGSPKEINPYRDAIDGFPCVVFFTDNPINPQTQSDDSAYTYAGTYMFNVDKVGDQLGFSLDPNKINSDLSAFSDQDKVLASQASKISCVSYEGAANNDESAAAFLPFTQKFNSYIANFIAAIKSGALVLQNVFNEAGNYKYIKDGKEKVIEVAHNGFSPSDYSVIDQEIYYKGNLVEDSDLNTLFERGKLVLLFLDSKTGVWGTPTSIYSYIDETLEPRKTTYDDNEVAEIYNPMINAIKWIYDNADNKTVFRQDFGKYFSYEYCMAYYLQMLLFTQVDNAGKNAMFDVWGYDLNNLRSGSKFGKLYPRPYDMDTQMGLNNSGADVIAAFAELHPELSPANCGSGEGSSIIGEISANYITNWDTVTGNPDHSRYHSYNTSNSFLWKSFGTFFKEEITKVYTYLRDRRIYDLDRICQAIDAHTCDKIGETYYNKDVSSKYLSYRATAAAIAKDKAESEDRELTEEEKNLNDTDLIYYEKYLFCANGSRKNRYRTFLDQRIAFLDSFFNYRENTNNLELRVGYVKEDENLWQEINGYKFVGLGIQVSKPQYVRFTVGSTEALYTALVLPDETYQFGDDPTPVRGSLFWLPITSNTNDKEVIITGAECITSFNHLQNFIPSKCLLGSCHNLTQLDLSNCSSLHTLSISSHATKLQKLDLTNTRALASAQGTALNLSGCENLVEIIATNSGINSLELPTKSSLQILRLTNAKNLTALSISNNSLLVNTELHLDGCTSLSSFSLNNCAGIEINSTEGSTLADLVDVGNLTSLSLINCGKIVSLDLSSATKLTQLQLNLAKLTNLNLRGLSSTIFKYEAGTSNLGLNLTNLPGLITLDLNQAGLPNTGTSTVFGGVILPTDSLKTLDLSASLLDAICAEGNVLVNKCYNFDKLNLTELDIDNNTVVEHITNLNYTVHKTGFFNTCSNLCQITAEKGVYLTVPSSLAIEMFKYCGKLESLPSDWLTFNDNIGSASSMFYECTLLDADSIKITARRLCTKKATSFASFALGCDKLEEIPTDFFSDENVNTVTDVSQCFRNCNNLKSVKTGAFKVLPYLEDISGVFCSCLNLETIPEDVFLYNTNINDVHLAFYDCSKLGKDSGLMSSKASSSKVFDENCQITSIEGIFYGCASIDPEDKLKAFFENIPYVTNAKLAFQGCAALSGLNHNVLNKNINLENIDGLFANSFTNAKEDFEIGTDFALATNVLTRLTSAKGVFSGCSKLKGLIGKDFFKALQNVTTIGSGSITYTDSLSLGGLSVHGFFTNTGIRAIHKDCLRNLNVLQKCDRFLCKISNSKLVENSSFEGFINDSNEVLDTIPEYFFQKEDMSGALPLKDLSFMFAYCSILTSMEDNCTLPSTITSTQAMFYGCNNLVYIPQNILHGKSSLTNTSYMFAGCTGLTTIDLANINSFFKGCISLSNCKGMFMNSGLSDLGEHYNNGTAVITANLFNDCRNSLTNTSYMFAGCRGLEGALGTGYAEINEENSIRAGYANYKLEIATGLITSANANLTKFRDTWLKEKAEIYATDGSLPSSSDFNDAQLQLIQELLAGNGFGGQDISKNTIISSTESSYIFTQNNGDEPISNTFTYYTWQFKPYDESETQWSYFFDNSALHSFTNYISQPANKEVEIIQYGLLANCPNLSTIEGMFLNCDHLIGPIPADLLYGDSLAYINSLAYLFCGCTRLATVPHDKPGLNFSDSCTVKLLGAEERYREQAIAGNYFEVYPHLLYDYNNLDITPTIIQNNEDAQSFDAAQAKYFVPKDWLAKVRNVTDISHIFSQVGSFDILSRSYSSQAELTSYASGGTDLKGVPLMLEIPNELFNITSNNFRIIKAAYAFFGNASIGNSKISADFLGKSVPSYLSDIQYIFALSNVLQVESTSGKFLYNKNFNNKLSNVTYAFAYANRIPYGKNKKTDSGTTFLDSTLYSDFLPNDRVYNGLTGEAIDFTTNFTIKNRQGAFVSQSHIPPYNSTEAKYDIYKQKYNQNEGYISYIKNGFKLAVSALNTAYSTGANI